MMPCQMGFQFVGLSLLVDLNDNFAYCSPCLVNVPNWKYSDPSLICMSS